MYRLVRAGLIILAASLAMVVLACQEKPGQNNIVGQWRNLDNPTVQIAVIMEDGRYMFEVTDSTGTHKYPTEYSNGSWRIGYPFAGAIASYEPTADRVIIRHGTMEATYQRLPK